MTVKQFAYNLLKLKDSLQEKEIIIIAPNGLEFAPVIKMVIDKPGDFENIKKVVVTYE